MECSSWQKKAIIAVHYFLLPDFSYFHVSFASTAVPVGRSFTSAPSSKSEQFVFIEIESVEIEYIGPRMAKLASDLLHKDTFVLDFVLSKD